MRKITVIALMCLSISLVSCKGKEEQSVTSAAPNKQESMAEILAPEQKPSTREETYNKTETYPELNVMEGNEESVEETASAAPENEESSAAPTDTAPDVDATVRTKEAVESVSPEELVNIMETDNGMDGMIYGPMIEWRYQQYDAAASERNEIRPVQFNPEIVREYDYLWKEANRDDDYICNAVNWYVLCADADVKTFTVSEVSANSIIIYYVLGDNTAVPLCQITQIPGDEDIPNCIIYSLI